MKPRSRLLSIAIAISVVGSGCGDDKVTVAAPLQEFPMPGIVSGECSFSNHFQMYGGDDVKESKLFTTRDELAKKFLTPEDLSRLPLEYLLPVPADLEVLELKGTKLLAARGTTENLIAHHPSLVVVATKANDGGLMVSDGELMLGPEGDGDSTAKGEPVAELHSLAAFSKDGALLGASGCDLGSLKTLATAGEDLSTIREMFNDPSLTDEQRHHLISETGSTWENEKRKQDALDKLEKMSRFDRAYDPNSPLDVLSKNLTLADVVIGIPASSFKVTDSLCIVGPEAMLGCSQAAPPMSLEQALKSGIDEQTYKAAPVPPLSGFVPIGVDLEVRLVPDSRRVVPRADGNNDVFTEGLTRENIENATTIRVVRVDESAKTSVVR